MRLSLEAPAKLNWFLYVTGKRPDGYHSLVSLFVPVSLFDTVSVESSDSLSRDGDLTGPAEKDLALRAAVLLKKASGASHCARITVAKRIPVGAGLGGGSSDAAAALVLLNELWGLGLSRGRLREIGLELGADVPFFIDPRPSWVEGIGEDIAPFDFAPQDVEIVYPEAFQATGAVFASPLLKITPRAPSREDFARAQKARRGFHAGENALEEAARSVNPEIDRMLRAIPELRLTGSGSAAFCPSGLWKNTYTAAVQREGWRHFSVKTLQCGLPIFRQPF